jgi:hypothetical protein
MAFASLRVLKDIVLTNELWGVRNLLAKENIRGKVNSFLR